MNYLSDVFLLVFFKCLVIDCILCLSIRVICELIFWLIHIDGTFHDGNLHGRLIG